MPQVIITFVIKLFEGIKSQKLIFIYLVQFLSFPINLKLDKTRDLCLETENDVTPR